MTVTVNGIGELQSVQIKAGDFDGSSADDLTDLGDRAHRQRSVQQLA